MKKVETTRKHHARKSDGGNAGLDTAFLVLCALAICFMGLSVFQFTNKPKQMLSQEYKAWSQDAPGYKHVMDEQKRTHSPVLVYFYAEWCPHCQELNAKVMNNKRVDHYLYRLPHVKIAPDHGMPEKQLESRYDVKGYPTLFVVEEDGSKKPVETFNMDPVNPRQKTPKEFIKGLSELLESVRKS
jgi:thiol:disulfide interchange protein